jgi:hypothetical protein
LDLEADFLLTDAFLDEDLLLLLTTDLLAADFFAVDFFATGMSSSSSSSSSFYSTCSAS